MIKMLENEATKKEVLKRLYNNQLGKNIALMGDKDTRKHIKQTITTLCEAVISRNGNKSQLKFYATDDEKNAVKKWVAYALEIKDEEVISNTMLAKAVVSACQFKFTTVSKGVKQGNWSYSVSTFLKAINASLISKIEKSSFAD